MDSTIFPEVTNPAPNATNAPPEHVLLENNGESISRSSSAARMADPNRSNLTELTGKRFLNSNLIYFFLFR